MGAEGVEEIALFEKLRIATGEEGHGVAATQVIFGFGAEGFAEFVGGFFELAEELEFFRGVIVLVDEGLLADAEIDGVEDLALARVGGGEVDHLDLGEGPAALGDIFDLRGGAIAVLGALLFDGSNEQVVVEEDHVHDAARLPGSSVELEPVAGFKDYVAAGHGGKKFLGALDLFPEGLQVGHVQGGEVGHGAPVSALAGGDIGVGHGVHRVGFEGGGGVVEVVEKGAECTHLGLELVDFLGDEDELGTVHKDIFLQVGGSAIADLLETFLVVLDLLVRGIGEDGGDEGVGIEGRVAEHVEVEVHVVPNGRFDGKLGPSASVDRGHWGDGGHGGDFTDSLDGHWESSRHPAFDQVCDLERDVVSTRFGMDGGERPQEGSDFTFSLSRDRTCRGAVGISSFAPGMGGMGTCLRCTSAAVWRGW